jgi:hypothetical protein
MLHAARVQTRARTVYSQAQAHKHKHKQLLYTHTFFFFKQSTKHGGNYLFTIPYAPGVWESQVAVAVGTTATQPPPH